MRAVILTMWLVCASFSVAAVDLMDSDADDRATLKLRESLVGTWQSKITQSDGGIREEYLTISKNGSFRVRFLSTNRMGRMVDAYAIVGIWGVAEDIFFTSNLKYEYLNDVEFPAYLGDAHEFNAYRILEINNSFQRYQAMGQGKNNTARFEKIASDPCEEPDVIKPACVRQDRILDPDGSNNGSAISLAE